MGVGRAGGVGATPTPALPTRGRGNIFVKAEAMAMGDLLRRQHRAVLAGWKATEPTQDFPSPLWGGAGEGACDLARLSDPPP